jgi:tripartite-type tricarboxylate transporter receptor subunit TctC
MGVMIRLFAATICAIALAVASAAAQPFPSRPVTMIVPYPPGGPTDTLARIFAERLRASLGQPVIIENVGGGAGSIGVARAARAAPDGYTINFGNVASHVFATVVFKLQYDVLTDLEPVALMTVSPMWLLSGVKLPANNLKELIAWLKANPDKASAAVVGPGSPAHLCGVYFQNNTGTRFQFVPYKGAGPAMQDVMSGQVELTCLEASATRAHVQAGKLRAYALLSKSRWPGAPEVPTIDEAGVPGLYLPFWHGLWVPKGTPRDAVARLNAAVVETLADPAMQKRLTELGVEIPPRDQQAPEALRAFLKGEIDKWRPIIEAANIKPDQ